MGDPAGTGPEIIAKAFGSPEVRSVSRPIVIGDAAVMRRALGYTGSPLKIRGLAALHDAHFSSQEIDVVDLRNVQLDRLQLGKVDAMAGKAAYEYVKAATEFALADQVGAIVTSALGAIVLLLIVNLVQRLV